MPAAGVRRLCAEVTRGSGSWSVDDADPFKRNTCYASLRSIDCNSLLEFMKHQTRRIRFCSSGGNKPLELRGYCLLRITEVFVASSRFANCSDKVSCWFIENKYFGGYISHDFCWLCPNYCRWFPFVHELLDRSFLTIVGKL